MTGQAAEVPPRILLGFLVINNEWNNDLRPGIVLPVGGLAFALTRLRLGRWIAEMAAVARIQWNGPVDRSLNSIISIILGSSLLFCFCSVLFFSVCLFVYLFFIYLFILLSFCLFRAAMVA